MQFHRNKTYGCWWIALLLVSFFSAVDRSRGDDLAQWYLAGFDAENGSRIFQHELNGEPLPSGLLVDRRGQAVVAMLKGSVICYGSPDVN